MRARQWSDGDVDGADASGGASGRGPMGRVLAQATDAVLASGALRAAVGRIACELEPALAAERIPPPVFRRPPPAAPKTGWPTAKA